MQIPISKFLLLKVILKNVSFQSTLYKVFGQPMPFKSMTKRIEFSSKSALFSKRLLFSQNLYFT